MSRFQQLFSLRDVIVENDLIIFRAKGLCMYPCIWPGDVMHVAPREITDITVGDIAVYRRNGTLVGHRTIEKGIEEGRRFIVTKPDNSPKRDDGPVFADDIVGVVTHVERNGKKRNPSQQSYSLLNRIMSGVAYYMYCVRQRLLMIYQRWS